jgi:hypothetical protein
MPHNADQSRFEAVVNSHAPSEENALSSRNFVRFPIDAAQYKTSFCHREVDDFELDSVLCGRFGCDFACLTSIDIADLDCFAGLGLRSLGKFRDLGLILFIGGCHALSASAALGHQL